MSRGHWSQDAVRSALEDAYHQAVARVEPGAAVRQALGDETPPAAVHVLAVGKAAPAMAAAAIGWLHQHQVEPRQLLTIAPAGTPAVPNGGAWMVGDHPRPGAASFAAAAAVRSFLTRVAHDDTLWLLLSGGTTSLIAAPVDGVDRKELGVLFDLLHSSGLDIHQMNTVRKRFLEWGAGRLATALPAVRCRVFAMSDVPGDLIESIGSGPAAPDQHTIHDVCAILTQAKLLDRLGPTLLANIASIGEGQRPETPKPNNPVFARVGHTIIANNRQALDAAAGYGRHRGWKAIVADTALSGEASTVGRSIGGLLAGAPTADGAPPTLYLWGGETSVTFDSRVAEPGGRCQELALAAARELTGCDLELGLLAAGTDGRDGATDAAGAIVDCRTWRLLESAGAGPAAALARHASHEALAAAGALFRPGLTGTNVMDLAIGLVVGQGDPAGGGR